MIDWAALLLVSGVTLAVTVLVVTLAAFAARLLTAGHSRKSNGQIATHQLAGAYSLLGVVGLIILFGLYLIIPYFH